MTLRLMGYISRLMQETSARLLSKILRLSQSSILRADKYVLEMVDKACPICMDERRALIIDEKYLGRDKKFVTCVIDAYTGEIFCLKEGRSSYCLEDFFRTLTSAQKESIEVVSIDRSNAYLKVLRRHLPHVKISFAPFHIIKNVNGAIDKVRKESCRDSEEKKRKFIKGKRYLLLYGEEHLSENKLAELEDLLKINKPLQEAYLLKEKIRTAFQFPNCEKSA